MRIKTTTPAPIVISSDVRGYAMDPLPRLARARDLLVAVEYETHELVAEARRAGYSWESIGRELGVSRQAAQQRYWTHHTH